MDRAGLPADAGLAQLVIATIAMISICYYLAFTGGARSIGLAKKASSGSDEGGANADRDSFMWNASDSEDDEEEDGCDGDGEEATGMGLRMEKNKSRREIGMLSEDWKKFGSLMRAKKMLSKGLTSRRIQDKDG